MEQSRKFTLADGLCGRVPWWSADGQKMSLNREAYADGYGVKLENNAAHLTVFQAVGQGWNISWHVSTGSGSLQGRLNVSTKLLMAAFGLLGSLDEDVPNFACEHGAELLVPETFIKSGDMVSFPGPSNQKLLISPVISIELTDEISAAVRLMIETCEQAAA